MSSGRFAIPSKVHETSNLFILVHVTPSTHSGAVRSFVRNPTHKILYTVRKTRYWLKYKCGRPFHDHSTTIPRPLSSHINNVHKYVTHASTYLFVTTWWVSAVRPAAYIDPSIDPFECGTIFVDAPCCHANTPQYSLKYIWQSIAIVIIQITNWSELFEK